MSILNLGIVAHVDAGKTSLTERLLYAGGVIDHVGSVDAGSTQTDSLALERQRGITIKTAVASFAIDGTTVNLIDTPGHPDFIAEVERALRVLDGAVLVISAVEGVQAQTRILMRTLRRMRVPTLLFVNKIDRRGARYSSLLRDIAEKLTADILPVSAVSNLGTRAASVRPFDAADAEFTARLVDLAGDEALLAAYVHDETSVAHAQLRQTLVRRSREAAVYPVFFGSAVTGAGVEALMGGIAELLPAADGDPDGPVSGTVFKVDRDRTGARIAYVRMFSGTVHIRDRLPSGHGEHSKVTTIEVVEGSAAVRRPCVSAGEIGKLRGLRDVRIGDPIGEPREAGSGPQLFAPPTLETVVVPRHRSERRALHAALSEMAEQDPLINLRQDGRQELCVSLYGEVQKEVIEATLAAEYGIEVLFRETVTVYVERPVGSGRAGETLRKNDNPYIATIDLLVEPTPIGTGLEFRLDVPVEQVPIHVYKTVDNFRDALADTVRTTLAQGLYGWQVIDVRVTATRTGFYSPGTTSAEFRKLVPLVLMSALRAAGTVVCQPIHRFEMDGPADTLPVLFRALPKFDAVPDAQEIRGATYLVSGLIPAAKVRELDQALHGLTHGEGLLQSAFHNYEPVTEPYPTRARWDDNPLNRDEYLLRIERRVPIRRDAE